MTVRPLRAAGGAEIRPDGRPRIEEVSLEDFDPDSVPVPSPPPAFRAKGQPPLLPIEAPKRRGRGRPRKNPLPSATEPREGAFLPETVESSPPAGVVSQNAIESAEKEASAPPKKQEIQVMENYAGENEDLALAKELRERRERRGLPTSEGRTADALLESTLSQEFETENNIKTVSKELFSKGSINVKTEISHNEINDITKLGFLKERFRIGNTDFLIQSLLEHRVSLKRKSRDEFIRALQTENRNANPAGTFMSKFFGGGANNGPG